MALTSPLCHLNSRGSALTEAGAALPHEAVGKCMLVRSIDPHPRRGLCACCCIWQVSSTGFCCGSCTVCGCGLQHVGARSGSTGMQSQLHTCLAHWLTVSNALILSQNSHTTFVFA